MKYPNTFLIGAPKAGTTSMAKYLAQHPEVYFSIPKEPFHHCTDFTKLVAKHGFGSESRYASLFEKATAHHRVVMEGSTAYLQSREAVRRIEHSTDSQARYIVMLRDPASLVASFHRTQLIAFNETERNLQTAWLLQEGRASGAEPMPDTCINAAFLQYRDVASLGSQVERLLETVAPDRVHFVVFDDFRSNPSAEYESTVAWLGIQPRPLLEITHENPGTKQHRYAAAGRFIQRPPTKLLPVVRAVRNQLRQPRFRSVNKALSRAFWDKSSPVPEIPTNFLQSLRQEFETDVLKLQRLTGRDLGNWLTPEARS